MAFVIANDFDGDDDSVITLTVPAMTQSLINLLLEKSGRELGSAKKHFILRGYLFILDAIGLLCILCFAQCRCRADHDVVEKADTTVSKHGVTNTKMRMANLDILVRL